MIVWALRRKFVYFSFILFFLGAFLVFWSIKTFLDKPNCNDGIQNQSELGVDCGGPCPILCKENVPTPNIIWARTFKLKSGIANSFAMLQNSAGFSSLGNIDYSLKIYDKDNIIIFEKRGNLYIPPKKAFGFFEGGINIGDREPARTIFEFTSKPRWKNDLEIEPDLKFVNIDYDFDSNTPYLKTRVENRTMFKVSSSVFMIIVYDANQNAIAVSKTELDSILSQSGEDIIFTWPEKFAEKGRRYEILYWRKG